MKKSRKTIFKVLATIILAFYLLIFITEIGNPEGTIFGYVMIYIMFLFYSLGYFFLWKNEKISGIIFVSWYLFLLALVVWVWIDGDMVAILGIPIPILGTIILIKSIKKIR